MYKISKEFHFSASHILTGLPPEHPCSRLHGHNYIIKVHLKSKELQNPGFVVDYRQLDYIKEFIDEKFDHRHLNDAMPCNPTAENIAKYLFDKMAEVYPEIFKIEVSETPKTNATYES